MGKTIDELTTAAGDENAVDLVSGATLVDTAGYLNAIAEAARNAQENQAVEFTGESDQLTLNVAYGAAHGTKCFTLASALTDGENIVLSYIDELQFMSSADGVTGVPNSDGGFGENIAEGKVLGSKRVNNDYYTAPTWLLPVLPFPSPTTSTPSRTTSTACPLLTPRLWPARRTLSTPSPALPWWIPPAT